VYPTFSDLLNDLLGTSFCLPVQTFGFFVAMAFIAAWSVLRHELIRKSKAGLFSIQKFKVQSGGPIPVSEVGYAALLWGLVGYKLGPVFTNNSIFCSRPQDALISLQGDLWIGLLAAAVAALLKYREFQQKKQAKPITTEIEAGAEESLGTVTMIAAIGGILGAKIFHNLENLSDFMQDPMGALLSFDGLTFYGGLIVASAAIIWHLRQKNIPLLPYLDAAGPALMLSYGVGRMGCQFSGDGDWGIVNEAAKPGWLSWLPDWAWAYQYPHNVIREGVPIPGCTGDFCFQLPLPVYPTPFYEVLMAISLALILWVLRKHIQVPGRLFALYLLFNGLERFLIEKIRVNTTMSVLGMEITQAEVISSILMLGGIVMFFSLKPAAEPHEKK
jgi:phosphatidylglycerol:prolipoprotein diacylglycerol transferase